jgi:hypothetical protein
MGQFVNPARCCAECGSKAQELFDDQGQPRADWVGRQDGRFLDELEWYANALKVARSGGVPY